MLRLRKILLCNYLYIIIFIVVIIISLIRFIIPYKSIYNENSNTIIGIIKDITIIDDYVKLEIKSSENVVGSLYLKDDKFNYELGDKVLITGEFSKPSVNTTNYLFNYRKYLERKRIYYLVNIDSIKLISKNKNIYYSIKSFIINRMSNRYLYCFLLGDKSYIDKEVIRSYQYNGISHLFAISGMHISLLASIILKILKRFKFSDEKIFIITSILLLFYLFLVGFNASIVRGVFFFILFSINRIWYFYIKPINLFIIVVSISLLINPYFIFDIGFQYSYLISICLIYGTWFIKSKSYLGSLLKVSILSFIVSIPITLYNFYQVNLLSILYNLFFVPMVSIIIFPFSLIVEVIPCLEVIYNIFIIVLESVSLFFYKIDTFVFIFKRVNIIIYFIYLILILLFVFRKKYIYLVVLFVFLLIHYLIPYFDSSDYIKMIDVGQGDSILLHSNNKNVLIDTGGNEAYNSNDGEIFNNTLYPIIKSLGIKKIDYLILTHGDKDHLGEAEELLKRIRVNKVIINSNKINYNEKKIFDKRFIIGYEGTSFRVGEYTFLQLNTNLDDENDSSQVYLVTYKNRKMLFTGDASIKSEEYILNNYDLGDIDILKVGHHGSRTSTSTKLLKSINPKISIISAGRDNKFDHPHMEVVELLNEYSYVLCTKEYGSITIRLDRFNITWDYKEYKK